MIKLVLFLVLIISFSCERSKEFKTAYENHKYDSIVINKILQYDTLRQVILNSYKNYNLGNTKNDFTYIYNFDTSTKISGYNNLDLPQLIYPKIINLFERIGKGNIFGFTIYRDSTIEILVRNKHLTQYFLDVRERLYWYPTSNRIERKVFPVKDTVLNTNWQYQIWYDKRPEF